MTDSNASAVTSAQWRASVAYFSRARDCGWRGPDGKLLMPDNTSIETHVGALFNSSTSPWRVMGPPPSPEQQQWPGGTSSPPPPPPQPQPQPQPAPEAHQRPEDWPAHTLVFDAHEPGAGGHTHPTLDMHGGHVGTGADGDGDGGIRERYLGQVQRAHRELALEHSSVWRAHAAAAAAARQPPPPQPPQPPPQQQQSRQDGHDGQTTQQAQTTSVLPEPEPELRTYDRTATAPALPSAGGGEAGPPPPPPPQQQQQPDTGEQALLLSVQSTRSQEGEPHRQGQGEPPPPPQQMSATAETEEGGGLWAGGGGKAQADCAEEALVGAVGRRLASAVADACGRPPLLGAATTATAAPTHAQTTPPLPRWADSESSVGAHRAVTQPAAAAAAAAAADSDPVGLLGSVLETMIGSRGLAISARVWVKVARFKRAQLREELRGEATSLLEAMEAEVCVCVRVCVCARVWVCVCVCVCVCVSPVVIDIAVPSTIFAIAGAAGAERAVWK
jgi:hypothetical protein